MSNQERRWNLEDILPVDKFDEHYSLIERKLEQFPIMLANLSPSMSADEFRNIILYQEDLLQDLNHLGYLPHLMINVNVQDSNAREMFERYKQLGLLCEEKAINLEHWIKGKKVEGLDTLDNKNAQRLFSVIPDLEYNFHIARDNATYTLNQSEEMIISEKDSNGISVVNSLRDMIVNDFEYKFKPKEAKRSKIFKTGSDLDKYRTSVKPEERQASYQALFEPFKKNIEKLFVIYQAVCSDWDKETKSRGFATPISQRNLSNNVPDKAVSTLLEVCSANTNIFQDFFKYKAELLGMQKLRRYDIYAPISRVEAPKIPFNKGIEIVLNTINGFSGNFHEKAKRIIDDNHIDSHPRKGKNSGAFCATISPKVSPYILTNYDGTINSISTLAHELGHGIHSLFAENKPASVQQAGLALAETASTFSEMILFDRLFQEANNNQVRKEMLIDKISSSYATIMRQAYFIKFEQLAHEEIQKGTTAEKLSDIYFETLKEQFGNSLEIDSNFRYEWSYIPHIFHTPFYCYAYSFGEILSTSLYDRYKQEGKSFIPKIENILEAGGSQNPQKILEDVGVDIHSKDFWQGGFNQIREMQKQLETL